MNRTVEVLQTTKNVTITLFKQIFGLLGGRKLSPSIKSQITRAWTVNNWLDPTGATSNVPSGRSISDSAAVINSLSVVKSKTLWPSFCLKRNLQERKAWEIRCTTLPLAQFAHQPFFSQPGIVSASRTDSPLADAYSHDKKSLMTCQGRYCSPKLFFTAIWHPQKRSD